MTRIRIDADAMRLEIDGHAEYAPIGQDIVCAGVSMLTYTLAKNLLLMLDEDEVNIDIGNGSARIEAHPGAELADRCRDVFQVIANGYALLAEQYGQYVQIGD